MLILLTSSIYNFKFVFYNFEVIDCVLFLTIVGTEHPSNKISEVASFYQRIIDLLFNPILAEYPCLPRSSNCVIPSFIGKHADVDSFVFAFFEHRFDSFPDNVFDSNDSNQNEVFFDLAPFVWYTIHLLVGESEGSEVCLGEMVDSLLYLALNWTIYLLNLLIFVDIIGAIGQQERGGAFDKEIQLTSLISVNSSHLSFDSATRINSFDSGVYPESFVVETHPESHLQQGTFSFIANVLNFQDFTVFFDKFRGGHCVYYYTQV